MTDTDQTDQADPTPTGTGQPDDRYERGVAVYARLMDIPTAEVPSAMDRAVTASFAEEVLRASGGRGWNSPELDERDRALISLTALVSNGIGGHRLDSHLEVARRVGLSQEAITATLLLVAHYCGYPRASSAMEVLAASVGDG